MARENQQVTVTFNPAAETITFDVLGCGELTLDLNKVEAGNRAYAEYHGWKQRIVDGAAIERADKDGNIIPKHVLANMKFQAMNKLIAHYEGGSDAWTMKSEGGAGRSIIIEAIARVRDISYEDAVTRVEAHAAAVCGGDRKKALVNLAKSPKVQEAMKAIRDERTPAADIDADSTVEAL